MEQLIYFFAPLFVGLLVGAAAMGLVLRARISSAEVQAKSENQVEIARLNERLTASQENNERLEMEKENLAALRDQLMAEQQRLSNQVAELTTTLESERTQNAEKIELLKNAEEQLSNRFKTLASEILEDKTKRFTEQNQTNLNQLLEPLKVKITEFQGKVQEVYVQEGKDRSALAEQVKQLMALNNQLSKDAHNLTSALKGQAKAETDHQRDTAMKRHLDSVRAHIKELSEKNYQQLYGLQSLDFVLMFIPVEPAFMLAISHDSDLWQNAWKKNVLLVSPSTLLFVVRTVAHLWRQEQQNRNAQDIASRGAELYDKLAGFVEDLDTLGNRLQQAQKAYDGAYNKFTGGRGNVIRQAEMLKELGVKPTKQFPQNLIDSALDEPLVLPSHGTL